MLALTTAARWGMIILLGGLAIVVVCKVLAGGIALSGLLSVKGGKEDKSFSSSRAQMLMATLATAMYYLLQVINNPSADSLPDVPTALVGILGGTQAIYLGGKVQDFLSARQSRNGSE